MDYLFLNWPVHRLSCGMQPANLGSRQVAERCGFRYEGRMRGLMFIDGAAVDGLLYGMTREDWAAGRGDPA